MELARELTVKDESVYISRGVQVPSPPDQQIKANKNEVDYKESILVKDSMLCS